MTFGHDLLVLNELTHQLGGIRLLGRVGTPSALSSRRLRTIDHYGIVYVLSSAGKYRDDNGVKRDIVKGNVILLFPGLAHRYFPMKGESWEEIYCIYNGEIFEPFFKNRIFSPEQPVIPGSPSIKEKLEEIAKSTDPSEQNGLLISLLMELATLQEKSSTAGWVEKAKDILSADSQGLLSLHDVAGQLEMSEQTFRKRFAAIVGVPPAKFRMQRRLDSAKRLLEQTRLTNRRISESLGFSDEFHFSKAFTSYAGQSPSAYRRQTLLKSH